MIERNTLYHLAFYQKSYFSGSYLGMRYRIEKVTETESDPLFLVTVFPGPLCFDATPDEKKKTKTFPFSEEGLSEICTYLNDSYANSPSLWEKGKRIL